MSGRDIALDLYNAFKGGRKNFISKTKPEEIRNTTDPKPVGDLISELVSQREWKDGLSEGEIFVKWREVVGDEIATRCEPIEIKDEKLIIQCVSTAWATQLNLVKNQVLESIQKIAPGIKALEILGPNAPSWRKGLRTVQGFQGPRDTYG
jgi:predicted nucleic acid-binding Zn ribbon protein